MVFYSYVPDESAHNAATTFEHNKKFIHWMYENKLFLKDVIKYYTKYGCIKHYRCENSMCI